MKKSETIQSFPLGGKGGPNDSIPPFDFSLSRRWLTGIPYEVAFWRSYYRTRRSREKLLSWSQYGRECELDHFKEAESDLYRPVDIRKETQNVKKPKCKDNDRGNLQGGIRPV